MCSRSTWWSQALLIGHHAHDHSVWIHDQQHAAGSAPDRYSWAIFNEHGARELRTKLAIRLEQGPPLMKAISVEPDRARGDRERPDLRRHAHNLREVARCLQLERHFPRGKRARILRRSRRSRHHPRGRLRHLGSDLRALTRRAALVQARLSPACFARRILAVAPALSLQQLVFTGRLSPHDAARLLELRRELAWRRKPLLERVLIRIGNALNPPRMGLPPF